MADEGISARITRFYQGDAKQEYGDDGYDKQGNVLEMGGKFHTVLLCFFDT